MPYKDPAQKLERNRQYKAERRDELAAKQRAYYQRTRARSDERNARYLAQRPLLKAALTFVSSSNRRARRAGATGHLYARDVIKLAGPCAYCGVANPLSWDHVMPLSRGGANAVANLVPCCAWCNKSKGDRLVSEWRP